MMDQGFSTEFAEIAAPQNCEVAARFPSLAAGQTDARNGLACVGCIDRGEQESHPRFECEFTSSVSARR
jgi:hypothetical protein